MSEKKLQGVFTALVTPFQSDGAIDEAGLRRLIERQLSAGVHGLVPCGTTGETPALDLDEWELVVRTAIEMAAGRVPVIPGTGSNNTAASVARTRRARELGADAALVVTPYYNKPNPAGLRLHYETIAGQGGLPVVLYNVPSRTGQNVPPERILDLCRVDGLIAVKEASGSLSQAMTILSSGSGRPSLLSGEDELTCAMTLMGGEGVISVVSNVDPEGTVRMVEAALAGRASAARDEHYRLQPLMRALFAETNPVPAKAALERLGLCEAAVRAPLAPASEATRALLDEALARCGLA